MENRPQADLNHGFVDVPASQSNAVAWMSNEGITNGTSPTTFSPEAHLTRAHIAAFLWRLAGKPQTSGHSFVDVSASWQQQPVAWLASTGITTGTSPTTFSPEALLTRAQLITFLYRYNSKEKPSKEKPGADTDDQEQAEDETDNGTADNLAADNEFPNEAITVPAAAPSGECAHKIAEGVYQWEGCAWIPYKENSNYHYSLSDEEATDLIRRIWNEVQVEGKPPDPPTSELVPAGSECATTTSVGLIIGCYDHTRHHIRRLDSFNNTLLHEVAHALIADHPAIITCASSGTGQKYQACVHNDLFRCVADHLYTRYAGIRSAGVCGDATQKESSGSDSPITGGGSGAAWTVRTTPDGGTLAFVDATRHNRPFPYSDTWAVIGVLCTGNGQLGVFLSLESGYLAGSFDHADRIPVDVYWWSDGGWSTPTESRWIEADNNQGAFMPNREVGAFLSAIKNHESVALRVYQFDGSEFGEFYFDVEDPDGLVDATVAGCEIPSDSRWGTYSDGDFTATEAVRHTLEWPYEGSLAHLVVRCRSASLDVYLNLDGALLIGGLFTDLIPVSYAVFPYGWEDWEQSHINHHFRTEGRQSSWYDSENYDAAFLPGHLNDSFVRLLTSGEGQIILVVAKWDDTALGSFVFDLHGAQEHVGAVARRCGIAV